jgi:lipid A 3-O-deacylase
MEARRFLKLICIVILLISSESFLRCEGDLSRGGMSFFFENDLVMNTDQYYTNGLKIYWFSPEFGDDPDTVCGPTWMERAAGSLAPLKGKKYKHSLSMSLVQKMFTSNDITIAEPAPGSWPYSGIAAMEIGIRSRGPKRLDSIVFSLGIVGKHSLAGGLQKWLHKFFDFKTPTGWHNEIRDQILINVFYTSVFHLNRWGGGKGFSTDFFATSKMGIGNQYIGAGAGLILRAGWNLPRDFGPSRISPSGQVFIPPQKFAIGFYAAVKTSIVLHDIFLDGSPDTAGPGALRKPFYGDFSVGLEIFLNRVKISYAGVLWTKRLPNQPRPHIFTSFNLIYGF